MTRYTFGGGPADFGVIAPSSRSGLVYAATSVAGGTAWSARTGGTQYTDLMAVEGGQPVCTDINGFVNRFQGPDGVMELWVDLGTGSRFHLRTSDSLLALFDQAGAASSAQAAAESYSDARAINSSSGVHSANFTATLGWVEKVDATSGPITATLPAGTISGNLIIVRKIDTTRNPVTITGSMAAGDVTLTRYQQSALMVFGGANWFQLKSADNLPDDPTPEDFGAAGNGTTDDTAAWQAFLNYISANQLAGRVPGKTYLIAGNLTVDAGNWSLETAGWRTVLNHTGSGKCLTIGSKTSGVARQTIDIGKLRITGTSAGSGGLALIGVQYSNLPGLRITGYTGAGAVGLTLDTQSVSPYQATSTNGFGMVYIDSCTNGLKITKDAADPGTDGSNFNSFAICRVRTFTGIGVDIDAGEFTGFFMLDSSTAYDGAVGLRINDDVTCVFGLRTDNSFGAGNTAVGVHLTANARDHFIANPTGNGPTAFIQRDAADTPGTILRQGWAGAAWVGDVLRSAASHGSYSSNFARTWDNIGTTAFSVGQVGFINTGFAQGGLKRCDTVQRKWLFVALDAIAVGASGRFAEPGAVCQVLCDTGAVNVGDTLVQSLATGGSATVNNAITDPSQLVGFARSSKASGAAGSVEAYIT